MFLVRYLRILWCLLNGANFWGSVIITGGRKSIRAHNRALFSSFKACAEGRISNSLIVTRIRGLIFRPLCRSLLRIDYCRLYWLRNLGSVINFIWLNLVSVTFKWRRAWHLIYYMLQIVTLQTKFLSSNYF